MKWIRWRGLAAFVVISIIVSIFWFLVIDRVIERYIEKTGTSIVGAKVELDHADLSLFPLGLTLIGLQVTDPSSPMRNAFEAGRIACLVDGVNLLLRKVTIDEMTVSGVRLNTPRKTSGEVEKTPAGVREEPPILTFEIPTFLMSSKRSLNRTDWPRRSRSASIRQKYAEALKSLPDQKREDNTGKG
jgi:uncharacterized protein (TIGR03545 family)